MDSVAVAKQGDGNRAFAFGNGAGAYAWHGDDNTAIAVGPRITHYAGTPDLDPGPPAPTPLNGSRNLAIAIGRANNTFAEYGDNNFGLSLGQGNTSIAGRCNTKGDLGGACAPTGAAGSTTGFNNNIATVIGNTSKAMAKAASGMATALGNKSTATVRQPAATSPRPTAKTRRASSPNC